MKKLVLLLATLNAFVYIISYVACGKKADACANVTCQNGGTCSGGTCTCPTGYTGANCETCTIACSPACQNGGTCACGICGCVHGYEGTDCSLRWADKFVHTWAETDSVGGVAHTPYATTITLYSSTDPTHFLINNVYVSGANVECRMPTSLTFLVDSANNSSATNYLWWDNVHRTNLGGKCLRDNTGKVVKMTFAVYSHNTSQSGNDTVFVRLNY